MFLLPLNHIMLLVSCWILPMQFYIACNCCLAAYCFCYFPMNVTCTMRNPASISLISWIPCTLQNTIFTVFTLYVVHTLLFCRVIVLLSFTLYVSEYYQSLLLLFWHCMCIKACYFFTLMYFMPRYNYFADFALYVAHTLGIFAITFLLHFMRLAHFRIPLLLFIVLLVTRALISSNRVCNWLFSQRIYKAY